MISLDDVIDALEFSNDNVNYYYNPTTNEIVSYNVWDFWTEEKEFDEVVPHNYIMLPTSYQINEYGMIEEFIETIDDINMYKELIKAVKGKGAFRRFKNTCDNLGIITKWYKFREDKYKLLAQCWCNENDIKFID